MASKEALSLRTTQRAPRSCLPCSSRKVKCNKAVPCSNCIRRGETEGCTRETVIVRGEVKTWSNPPSAATTEDLQKEIGRLQRELDTYKNEGAQRRQTLTLGPRKCGRLENDDALEFALWDSIASSTLTSRSRVCDWGDIFLANRDVSEKLVAYDEVWNSWVHYALEYPSFKEECDQFMSDIERGTSMETVDPFWLSVYFSVLCAALMMMDDEEAEQLLLSEGLTLGVEVIGRTWYDAAIFCLNRAEFMRVPHICTVQAVAILGMVSKVFGDAELCQHMRSCAIRVGRRLGLDTPQSDRAGSLSPEAQHRLWWTLIICEWLNAPYEPPQVDEVDFDVPLPRPEEHAVPDTEGHHFVDPAHYHLFMARTASVYNRFCQSIVRSVAPLEDSVRAADDELAQVIDTLPEYLQPDFTWSDQGNGENLVQPWVQWQRFDITLVLLHHRIRINRALQRQWAASPGQFAWARAVSIRSAMDIIWINRHWDQPVSMRKQWALSFHLFVASILLLREWRSCTDGRGPEYEDAIGAAIHILEQVETHNAVAHHAIKVLRKEIGNMPN